MITEGKLYTFNGGDGDDWKEENGTTVRAIRTVNDELGYIRVECVSRPELGSWIATVEELTELPAGMSRDTIFTLFNDEQKYLTDKMSEAARDRDWTNHHEWHHALKVITDLKVRFLAHPEVN